MRKLLLPAILLLTIPLGGVGAEPRFDLVLRNGLIVDGSGTPARTGAVAIVGGRVAAIGTVDGKGREEIDVKGAVIAPGFIDVHTHSENILELPEAENFVRMGVTTIVTGNCGGSKLSVSEFFADLRKSGVALNVATLIGHNTVRAQVMGGSFARPPTPAELDQMRSLVDRAMRDGAVGLSTGLIYLPGTFAKTEEIVELAKVASAHQGIYATHMRYENHRIMEALEETMTIGRGGRIPVQVSHLKLAGPAAWGLAEPVLTFLDRARAEGLAVTHDQYVYTASSTSLGTPIPSEAREGGRARFRERVADPEEKARIVAGIKETLRNSQRTDFTYAVVANFEPDKRLNGRNVKEIAQMLRGSDTLDDQIEVILDLEARGGASAVFHGMKEENLRRFLVHPLTMIASDGGPRTFGEAVPHPRSYGNNARVLARYVRELGLLTVEEAVRKMTSLPARTFRLGQRGELREGFVADVVVFDPAAVADPSTFNDPHHYATGFSEVIVGGVPVIRAAKPTGARPGVPVKRS